MVLFDKIKNKLFPENKEVTVHEVLKRSPHFIKSYEEWKKSDDAGLLMEEIHQSYLDRLASIATKIDIEVYHSPYANGFIIYPQQSDISLPVEYLMEYIRDILEKERYRLVHSDRKMKEDGKNVRVIEKYYLKPPISSDIPIDQLYGNVIMELSSKDHQSTKFKMICNIYSDRLYNKPRNFEDLISLLFEKRTSE